MEQRPNPLRTDVTTAHSELFRGHECLKGTNLQLNVTLFTSCTPTNFDKELPRPGAFINETLKKRYSKCRDTFSAINILLPLVMSMRKTLGLHTQARIKAMMVSHVDLQGSMPRGWVYVAAGG